MDTNKKEIIKVNSGLAKSLAQGLINLDVMLKNINVLHTNVAGVYYHSPEEFADAIKEKDTIELKREPNNEYDKFAIALYFQGIKIGFIPKDKNEVMANLMDAGKSFFGLVTQKGIDDYENLALEVEIFMKG